MYTALVYHVPYFLEKCGSISNLNCQPVEKKNHKQSPMFNCGTQKGGRLGPLGLLLAGLVSPTLYTGASFWRTISEQKVKGAIKPLETEHL